MITVTKRGFDKKTFQNHLLEAVCLQLAGGGYTEAQTARAMIALSTLNDKGKGSTQRFHHIHDGGLK